MRISKITALLLMAALTLSCVCGCAAGTGSTVPAPSSGLESAAQEPLAASTDAPAGADEEYTNEFSLTRVRMTGRGDNTNGFKVAFRESESMEGVKAFVVCYSQKSTAEVRDCLAALTYDEILALDKPENRAYVIKDLSYADGVGNTLNTDQRDVVTGVEFTEPGTYSFYACTVGENGLLGIARAEQTVSVAPYANALSVKYENGRISGRFASYENAGIKKNLIFYSANGLALEKPGIAKLTFAEAEAMVNENRAVWYDNGVNTNYEFTTDMLDAEGGSFDPERVYYVYVASVGEDGVTGVWYNCTDLITPDAATVTPLASIGAGAGAGWVFPNGGAASINGTRDSIIGASQMMFKGIDGKPRIAVIGASSGSEKEIYSYFYVDESSVESYEHRFDEAGFEAVYIPLTMENYETVGQSAYYAALIESCHGVYFTGGNQSLCARALRDDTGDYNACGKAVMDTYAKDGIIMGTSAGAHVVSSPCFQDGDSIDVLSINGAEPFDIMSYSGGAEPGAQTPGNSIYYDALDLTSQAVGEKALFDSHFSARGRFGRLALVIRDAGVRFGIGLDESTGLAVSQGVGTAFGNGTVTIIDSQGAEYATDGKFTVKRLNVYCLSAGDKFDFNSQILTPASTKTEFATGEAQLFTPDDIFGTNYATVKAFTSFVLSGTQSAEFPSAKNADGGSFLVTLTRTEETRAWCGEKKYTAIGAIAHLPVTAYGGLLVDIAYVD